MAHLSRTQFGNPILRKKAKKIPLRKVLTPAFKRLIHDMFATIQDIGIGLAAPQIGKSIQLAVIDIHSLPHRPHGIPMRRVLINPEIVRYSRKTESEYEGCLSCEGIRGSVPRSSRVEVCYYNEKSERCQEVATGLFAKVLQHEIDHLNGILYVDRMKNITTLMTVQEYSKRISSGQLK